MKIVIKYIWPVFFTFILLMCANALFSLFKGENVKFDFFDCLSFFVGAIVISIFLKSDSLIAKKR